MANGEPRVIIAQFVEQGVRHEVDLDADIVGAVVVNAEDLRRAQKGQELATGAPVVSAKFDWEGFQPGGPGRENHGVIAVRSLGAEVNRSDEPVWWHVVTTCNWLHSTDPPPE